MENPTTGNTIMENPTLENPIVENPQDELNQGLLYDRVTHIEVMQQLIEPFNEFTDSISENIYIPNAINTYSDYTTT